MARQHVGADVQASELSRRQERALRILDAAATLILRWGYQKTTLDDISRQAGVAKGTIYLHWKTREALFEALIRREKVELAEDLVQRLTADPEGATLRSLFTHSTLALMQRPLLKALLLRDMDVLGKLAYSQQSSAANIEKLAGFSAYISLLRAHGLVRTDLSLREQVALLSSVFMGFLVTMPLMPDDYALSDEALAALIGETIHRTLEPDCPPSDEARQIASEAFRQFIVHATERAQARWQQELDV